MEATLRRKLPDANIEAKPLIDNRLRHFKGVFNIVHDMITCPTSSGFGWDSEKKCVTAEKEVWRAYLKSHPKAKPYREKSCPYYEDFCIIFGKNRATGSEARGYEDLEEEVNKEETHDVDESSKGESKGEKPESSTTQGGNGKGEATSSGSQRKRAKAGESLVKGLTEAATILGKELRAASSEISRAVGFDVVLSEKRVGLNEHLSKLGLDMLKRHQAASRIASKPEMVDLFSSIPDEEKLAWVNALLAGEI